MEYNKMYMNEREMEVLETQVVQRDFDKRWERIVKVLDRENAYTYRNEAGINATMIPEKWITVDVYDFILEIGGKH
jgi:hypothetical protein